MDTCPSASRNRIVHGALSKGRADVGCMLHPSPGDRARPSGRQTTIHAEPGTEETRHLGTPQFRRQILELCSTAQGGNDGDFLILSSTCKFDKLNENRSLIRNDSRPEGDPYLCADTDVCRVQPRRQRSGRGQMRTQVRQPAG